MNRHLTDDEVLDLLAEAPAREHLEECPECRARVEAQGQLSEALAALPAEVDPPRDLWPDVRSRVVAGSRVRALPGLRWSSAALQVAAAVAIFALGAAVGRGGRPSAPVPATIDDPLLAAAEVQRTGTEYVAAVARFRDLAGTADRGQADQARDVALAAVTGAAWELTWMNPADPTTRAIVALAGGDGPVVGAP